MKEVKRNNPHPTRSWLFTSFLYVFKGLSINYVIGRGVPPFKKWPKFITTYHVEVHGLFYGGGRGSDSQNYYGYLFLRRDATGSTICSCKVKFFRLRWASLSKFDEIITQISPPVRRSFGNDLFFGKKIFRPSATPIIKHLPYIVKLEITFICDLYLFMNLFIIRFVHQCLYADIQNKQENCCMVFVWFNRQNKFI